jgi:very-short-patch-repair endonuclease
VTATGPARKERPRDAEVAAGNADRGDAAHLSVAPDPRASGLEAARTAWSRRLVELGGPNTLLWFRDHPSGTLDLSRAHLGARSQLLGGSPTRLTELVREPAALDDARRRAEAIARSGRDALESHGVRTCFLAIGMAAWTVRPPGGDGRAVEAMAPVLLRACTVRPVGALHGDWSLDPGPELELNPVLVQYMASAHGISLDAAHLEDLALSGSTVDAYPTYAALADACSAVPDLSVAPRVVVGTFPYFKAALVADLAARTGPRAQDGVVALLAGVDASPPSVGAATMEAPERLVLDSDAVQRAVVEAARAGTDLVVHGPPGTGKTQTVANLVAALAAEGQRVLLVANRRAAIEAVTERLGAVGLDDLVLDVGGGGHERRRVVRELVEGVDRFAAEPDDEPAGVGRAVGHRAQAVAELDDHLASLHEPRAPWGVSLHDVQEAVSSFAATDHPPRSRVRLRDDVLARLDPTTLASMVRTLTRLAELGRWGSDDSDDPWYGARLEDGATVAEARDRVARLAGGGVEETGRTLTEVFRGIQLPRHPTVLDWARVLRTVGEVRDTLEVFRPEVFDIPLGDLVTATAPSSERRTAASDLGQVDRWRLRRQARALLRPGRPPEDLHAALASAHEQRDAWRELAGSGGRPEIPVELDRARISHAALAQDLRWFDERLPRPDEGGGERGLVELDLPSLRARVQALADSADHLDAAPEKRAALDVLDAVGLRPLADDLRARAVTADDVQAEVEWVWWCSIAEQLGRDDRRVAQHDGRALTARVEELAEVERAVIEGTPARVRAAVGRRVRELRRRYAAQETRLRAEAGRVRPAPLPELVAAVPDLATAVRPCWAMSTLDVPSVLPPVELFDVVVLEEASSIAAAEAVPAIARGRHVLVVGDSAQSPPSTFQAGPDAVSTEDPPAPSVLDLLAPAVPAHHLRWHHRSRDGRLVDFVDAQVYGRQLVTFPDTDRSPVTSLELVDGHGVVTAGDAAVETTRAEVERVVALVLDHARRLPDRSLAVVALNAVHAERIDQAVRAVLPELDERTRAFFDDRATEPFTVRALDRAQALERDDVVVTVGFGRTPHGRVLHRFGALGTDAGHGHLVVALTRARRTMTVVSTLTAGELDPERLRAPGPVLLRELLEHLERRHEGIGRDRPSSGPPAGSVVLADLARLLRAHGLTVHEDVGVGADPVDLAVEDPTRPGSLALAVESDGPRYAAVADGRDRDRLRAEVLRRRGWRHLRVWSTDLYRDPARDLSRVLEAIGVREAPGDD